MDDKAVNMNNFHMRYKEPCPVCGTGTMELYSMDFEQGNRIRTYNEKKPVYLSYRAVWVHKCTSCGATIQRITEHTP